MPIYTRTGDTGTTALFGGKRVLKCEELVDVYGSIDELNSWVGLVSAECTVDPTTLKLRGAGSGLGFLQTVQSDLFTIGSTLAGWKGDLGFVEERVKEMEVLIDSWEKDLPELRNFILPGGSVAASHIHVARSICRRVERQLVGLSQKETVDPLLIQYLNRLSDLFFMMARFINKSDGSPEIVWSGKHNT